MVGGLVYAVGGAAASWYLYLGLRAPALVEQRDANDTTIKPQVDRLAQAMGVTKPLLVKQFGWHLAAEGIALFSGPAGIKVDSQVSNVPEELREFLLAHEIAHIKHNDALIRPILLALVTLIIPLALSHLGFIAVSAIGLTALYLTHYAFSRFSEERADKTAFTFCSHKGKLQAIATFKEFAEEEQPVNIFWRFHPTDVERANYLEKMIQHDVHFKHMKVLPQDDRF